MKSVVIASCLLAFVSVHAADCPTPKPLTREQLKAKMEQRCIPEPEKVCPPPVECPPPTVITVPGPVERTIIYEDVPVYPPAKGHILFGGGPVYFHGLGVTAVAGYQFKNRLQVLAGPMYVPQNGTAGYKGSVTNCDNERGGGHDSHCATLPYSVPGTSAKTAWGGQLLVVYGF